MVTSIPMGSLSPFAKSRGFCSSSSFPAPYGGARNYMAMGSEYMALESKYMAMGSECMSMGTSYVAMGGKYMAVGSLSALAKSRGFCSSSSFPAPSPR